LAKERLEARRRSSEGQSSSPLPITEPQTLIPPSISLNALPFAEPSQFVAKRDDVTYLPLPNTRPVPISVAEVEVNTQSGDSYIYSDSQMTSIATIEAKTESADRSTSTREIVTTINYSTNSSSSRRLYFQSFPERLKMFCSIYHWSSSMAVPMTDTDIGACAMNVSPTRTAQKHSNESKGRDGIDEMGQPCIIYWPSSVFRRSGNNALALVEHLSQSMKAPVVAIVRIQTSCCILTCVILIF
jgi:hypothetical protein